jgi:alanyl-tRNA synthetase
VPATFDPSVLLTTAGCTRSSRTSSGRSAAAPRLTTLPEVLPHDRHRERRQHARHLTFFEMLGNFSIGDYFKQGAVELAWELSLEGFGFKPEDIWISVFEGDPELGLGPDEEAIAAWSPSACRVSASCCSRARRTSGRPAPPDPAARVRSSTSTGAWSSARSDDLPGGDNDRFLEYWNLVFMQFDQDPVNELTPLPAKNIDTGLGLNRMALVQQGVPTVFETDQFAPLMALGHELATRDADERALRILADHLARDDVPHRRRVVPSNEDRGYILRRVMRRAIQQAPDRYRRPLPPALRRAGGGHHGRRLRGSWSSAATRSSSGSARRRRASAARWSKDAPARRDPGPRASCRRPTRSACTTPTASDRAGPREVAAERGVPFEGDASSPA